MNIIKPYPVKSRRLIANANWLAANAWTTAPTKLASSSSASRPVTALTMDIACSTCAFVNSTAAPNMAASSSVNSINFVFTRDSVNKGIGILARRNALIFSSVMILALEANFAHESENARAA